MNQSQPEDGRPKLGAPTKYLPQYCQGLIDHMSLGFSFESFAATIPVNPDTLYEWANKHIAFSEAKKVAWAKSLLFFEREALEVSTGDKKAFSTTMLIFIMKCRFRKIYNDTADVPPTDITITIVNDQPLNESGNDNKADTP